MPHGSTFGHGSPLAVHLGFYPIGTDAFAAGNVFLNLVIVDGLYLAERERYFLLAGARSCCQRLTEAAVNFGTPFLQAAHVTFRNQSVGIRGKSHHQRGIAAD